MNSSQLLEIRKLLNLSQDSFASELGISRTFLSLMETGLKPISKRTMLSALYLKSKVDCSNVISVNNVKSVNYDDYLALANTVINFFTRRAVENNVTLRPFLDRGKSKDVRRACDQIFNFLSSRNADESEILKLHFLSLSNRELSEDLTSTIESLIELHIKKFGRL